MRETPTVSNKNEIDKVLLRPSWWTVAAVVVACACSVLGTLAVTS